MAAILMFVVFQWMWKYVLGPFCLVLCEVLDGGIFKRSIELFIALPLLCLCPCPQGVSSLGLHGGQKFWVWFVIELLLTYLLALSICHEADECPMNYYSDFTELISSELSGRIACGHHICRILDSCLPMFTFHTSVAFASCFKKYFIFLKKEFQFYVFGEKNPFLELSVTLRI